MAARITNSVTAALNQVHGLPHFLVIMPDKDILSAMNVFDEDIEPVLREYVNWMVRQISILVRRKKAELLDKKPGAIYAGDPVIIFTRMIRRPANLGRAKTQKVYFLRAKFSDALNDAVARIDQHILTINSCNSTEHFDQWGNLTIKGKKAIWYEINDLLERFDKNEVKLLPAPNLKQKKHKHHHHQRHAVF